MTLDEDAELDIESHNVITFQDYISLNGHVENAHMPCTCLKCSKYFQLNVSKSYNTKCNYIVHIYLPPYYLSLVF